jgi:hypothetical protein
VGVHKGIRGRGKPEDNLARLSAWGWTYSKDDDFAYTAREFIEYVLVEGYAVSNLHNDGHRTKKTFAGANTIFLDFDNTNAEQGYFRLEDAQNDAFIREYAFLVYQTPSHQRPKLIGKPVDGVPAQYAPPDDRFRVCFVLDDSIVDGQGYERLVAALLQRYPSADASCKDSSRFFYGTINAQYTTLGNVLPVSVVQQAPSALVSTVAPPVTKDKGEKVHKQERTVEHVLPPLSGNPLFSGSMVTSTGSVVPPIAYDPPALAYTTAYTTSHGAGERHGTLTSLLGHILSFSNLDATLSTLETVALDWNRNYCNPPKPDDEILTVVKYFWENYRHLKDEDRDIPRHVTDEDLGGRFTKLFRPFVRWNYTRKKWMSYDNGVWVEDDRGIVHELFRHMLDSLVSKVWNSTKLSEKAKSAYYSKLLKYKQQADARLAVSRASDSQAEIKCAENDFDADPWSLNVRNGILNLKTGELRPHTPEGLHSMQAGVPYDPQAECPKFREYLRRITKGDTSLMEHIQVSVGLVLVGTVLEQRFSDGRATMENRPSRISLRP